MCADWAVILTLRLNPIDFLWLIMFCISGLQLIPVAARSKAWLCGSSFVGIVGLNPTGAWKSFCCERCVLSGRGHCDGTITRPGEPTECVRV
jgi:hypothetical protein